MSKGLEALERLYCAGRSDLIYVTNGWQKKDYELVEKALKEYEGAKNHIEALHKERVENSLKLKALEIIKKYPNNRNSLANFRYMVDYWKKNNIEITKELLETYDFPFELEEYDLLKEVML